MATAKDFRKEADDAQNKADEAQDRADEAQEKADEAQQKADEETDPEKKEKLQQEANELQKKADEAQQEANEKQSLADKKDARATKEENKEIEEEKEKNKERNENLHKILTPMTLLKKINEPYLKYRYKVFFVPGLSWCKYKVPNKKGKRGTLTNKAIITAANLVLGFNEISTIYNETTAYAYQEGGENSYGNTFPEYTGAGDVTFKHGATRESSMALIRNMIAGSTGRYCSSLFSLLIFMYSKKIVYPTIPQIWVLKDVWPTKIEIGGFSTNDIGDKDEDNIVIESLTVSVERAELDVIRAMNAIKNR